MPIITIQSYNEIELSIQDPSQVIFMSDIDLTAIDVLERRIMSDTNQKERFEFIKRLTGQITPNGDAVSIAYSDAANRYSLVEPGFEQFIRSLQGKGYYVMAVTSRRTGLPTQASQETAEDNVLRKLFELGIDFSQSSPSRDMGVVSLANRMEKSGSELQNMHDFNAITGPICKNGALFTASHPKGPALDTYFANIHFKPQMIIALDDSLSKLESMQAYCDANGIQFVGYHYLSAELIATKFPLDMDVVALHEETILKQGIFISDSEARSQLYSPKKTQMDKSTSTESLMNLGLSLWKSEPLQSKWNYQYQCLRDLLREIEIHIKRISKPMPEDMVLSELINDEVTPIELDKCITAATRLEQEFKQELTSNSSMQAKITAAFVVRLLPNLKSFRDKYLADLSGFAPSVEEASSRRFQ